MIIGQTFQWSDTSKARLETCHSMLQTVANQALSLGVIDLIVLEGHRSVERQKQLFREGYSKIDGVSKKGKHNYEPSLAIDISPYPVDWNDRDRWVWFGGFFISVGAALGIRLRWGGDWDGDLNLKEHKFWDAPHFELVGED